MNGFDIDNAMCFVKKKLQHNAGHEGEKTTLGQKIRARILSLSARSRKKGKTLKDINTQYGESRNTAKEERERENEKNQRHVLYRDTHRLH